MIRVKKVPSRMVEGKKTIIVSDVYVNELKFVDETGDITQDVLNAIPEGIETVSFKIDVPEDEE